MQQMHISLVRHKLSEGTLTLVQPKELSVGLCKFRDKEGNTTTIQVVKYSHK